MLDPNSDSDLIIFPGLFIFILRFHEKLCEWYAAKRNIKDYCCIHNFKVFNISVYLSENQQDNSNTPQMEMDSKTSSENIDNLQAEGPRDQTVSPEETVYVTLDVNIKPSKGRKHRLRVTGELTGGPQLWGCQKGSEDSSWQRKAGIQRRRNWRILKPWNASQVFSWKPPRESYLFSKEKRDRERGTGIWSV